jgi:hypothetical protein
MKRQVLLIVVLLICSVMNAQTNPVDELFNKYSEQEGFTYVAISGRMLNFLGNLDTESKPDNIMLRLNSIRILTENDSLSTWKVNFWDELSKKLNFSVYEELMVVKEGKDITKFLVKQNGKNISELLVISGGKGSNSIISIKGDINLKDLSEISKTTGIEELEGLEDYEKKQE